MTTPYKATRLSHELFDHPYTRELRGVLRQVPFSDLACQDLFCAVLRGSETNFSGSFSQIWPSILIG